MQKTQLHEQHSEGAAFIDDPDDEDSSPVARIAPATIGDRVAGHRSDGSTGEYSIWDEGPLREAFESGALADIGGRPTRVVLGEGGENPHFPIFESVPPENILGQVERWEWEDGTGPVGYAPLADEEIAKRIDLGLLEVSADWLRFLGEYDEERGGRLVDEIVALPRVTILDRGANSNASIEISPEMAEALGYVPGTKDTLIEQLSDGVTVSEPSYSGTVEDGSWEAPTLEDTFGGDMDAARDSAMIHRGGTESFSDLALFVVDGEGRLSLPGLTAAKSRAPQTDDVSGDVLDRVQATIDTLAAEEFDRDWTGDEEQNASQSLASRLATPFLRLFGWQDETSEQLAKLYTLRFPSHGEFVGEEHVDDATSALEEIEGISVTATTEEENAEIVVVIDRSVADLDSLNSELVDALDGTPFERFPGFDWVEAAAYEGLANLNSDELLSDELAESSADRDNKTETMDPTELHEQLAETRARATQYENENDQLEDERSQLEEQLSEKDDRVEELEEQLAEKDDRVDKLEEQLGEQDPITEMLAGIVAEGSMLSVEAVAEQNSPANLVDMICENADADDDADPMEIVQEQMAGVLNTRGRSPTEPGQGAGGPGGLSEEEIDAANDRAFGLISGTDISKLQGQQGITPREYVAQHKGVDPAEYSSKEALRTAYEREQGDA